MKISLRTLLLVSGLASVVIGACCNQYLNSLRIEKRVDRFTLLGRACEKLETTLMNELAQLPDVKRALADFQKQVPGAKVADVVMGGYSGGFASSQSNVLLSKWAVGQIRVEYTYSLVKTFGASPEPIASLEIFGELDAHGEGPHPLIFRFPDSELNRSLADVVVAELAKENEFDPLYEVTPDRNSFDKNSTDAKSLGRERSNGLSEQN